jgi:predicted dehydrogenase
VFGDWGFLQIDGKGGSYGEEKLIYGKRRPEFGVPEIETFAFPGVDESWEREWEHFVDAIEKGTAVSGSGADGLAANELIEAIYRSSREKKIIKM